MTTPHNRFSLNRLLTVDALTCAGMGALLVGAGGAVAALTALPEPLLFWAGVLLFPVAAFMALSAMQRPVPAAAAFLAISGNWLWVAASLVLPLLPSVHPTPLGWAFVYGQAAVVAVLAVLEGRARSQPALAA